MAQTQRKRMSGADRQSSTPKDDQQTPSGGAEGTSRDGLDGGLPFTFGLQDSGIRHAHPPGLAAYQGPHALRLARERQTLEEDTGRLVQAQRRIEERNMELALEESRAQQAIDNIRAQYEEEAAIEASRRAHDELRERVRRQQEDSGRRTKSDFPEQSLLFADLQTQLAELRARVIGPARGDEQVAKYPEQGRPGGGGL